jgi:hypothetical protein
VSGSSLWSSGQSSWLQIQRSRVRFSALPHFLRSSGSETGSTQPREDFFNSHSGGGVQAGSTRHVGHWMAYCTCPGWLWWWRIWWNKDWQGKPKYSEKTYPSVTLSTTNPTWPDPGCLVRIIEELLEWKSSGSGQENRINGRGIRCTDQATPSIRKSWHYAQRKHKDNNTLLE